MDAKGSMVRKMNISATATDAYTLDIESMLVGIYQIRLSSGKEIWSSSFMVK